MAEGDLDDMPLGEMFREELSLQTSRIRDLMSEVARGAAADRPLLERLGLAAHSARGAAKIVGLEPVVLIAHEIERLAASAQTGKLSFGAPAVAAVVEANELLSAVVAVPEEGWPAWQAATSTGTTALLARLAALHG